MTFIYSTRRNPILRAVLRDPDWSNPDISLIHIYYSYGSFGEEAHEVQYNQFERQ
jgi:hypothetical protein